MTNSFVAVLKLIFKVWRKHFRLYVARHMLTMFTGDDPKKVFQATKPSYGLPCRLFKRMPPCK